MVNHLDSILHASIILCIEADNHLHILISVNLYTKEKEPPPREEGRLAGGFYFTAMVRPVETFAADRGTVMVRTPFSDEAVIFSRSILSGRVHDLVNDVANVAAS
jgi:hypothetical protein